MNKDQLKNNYLSSGILGRIYHIVDTIGSLVIHREQTMPKCRKLLFINLGLIGDLILFRYVIADFLKLYYEIDILIQDEYKFIFADCPNINLITIKGYKDKKIISGFYKIVTALFKNDKKYDVSCHFRGYLGTGILSTYLSRVAKYSIGYPTSGFGFLLNKVVPWRDNVHETQHLLDILNVLEANYGGINLNVFDNITASESLLINNSLITGEYVVVHATSQDARKNIPSYILSRLLSYIDHNSKLKIVFVGAKNEIGYIVNSFPENFTNYVITNGKIAFWDLRILIANAKLFIGVDSSIAHFLANVNVPKIILWHNLNSLEQWSPLGSNFTIIRDNNLKDELLTTLQEYI